MLRVLDAFRPRGVTWSGQVISSPPGPSGGPSKTHLLPGGRVPRVHRARSPVPPRLYCFATPHSSFLAAQKDPVSGPKVPSMKGYSPIEDLDKQILIIMLMQPSFPRLLRDFHFRERRGRTLLKRFLNREFIGGDIEAFHLRPTGLDVFFDCLFRRVAAVSERLEDFIFQLSIRESFAQIISFPDQIVEALLLILNLMEDKSRK